MGYTLSEASERRIATKGEEKLVMHHVANGGCLDDFKKAMEECRGRYSPNTSEWDKLVRGAKRTVDVEACIEATAALRRCFAGNPAMFQHQYLRRLDHGLDQDTQPSEHEIWRDEYHNFRWWTGMRRS